MPRAKRRCGCAARETLRGYAMRNSSAAKQLLPRGGEQKPKKPVPEAVARDRMLTILDRATVLVAMADRDGALFYVNPACRTVLGVAGDHELSGIALLDCLAPSVRAHISAVAIPAALSSGAWSGDCVLQGREGRQIDVSLLITAHRDDHGGLEGLSLLAHDMSAWTRTTAALRITQNELLRLSAQHLTVQEDERRRIAADLHDGLGQSLGLVIVSLETMANLLSQGEPEKAAACLDRLKPKVRDTLDELRHIAMNLRPATLDSLGILPTLFWHLREIEAACPGIVIERKFSVDESDVPSSLRTPIFRILQEAGSNAIKHGGADRVTVRLSKLHGVLELAIEDNGKGFDPDALSGNKGLNRGLGLRNMRERAELSCGVCEIQSTPGKGTRICVRWPASLKDVSLDRVAALVSVAGAMQDLEFSEIENPRDLEMLHNLSVCVACIRSIKSNG